MSKKMKKLEKNQELLDMTLGIADWEDYSPEPVSNPQEIFSISHDYFHYCFDNNIHPTATGLAVRLNMTRSELLQLKKNIDTPQGRALYTALSIVIDLVERELVTTKAGQPGLIFWLKNMDDWVDKTEVVSTQKTMQDFLDDLKKSAIEGETVPSQTDKPRTLPE